MKKTMKIIIAAEAIRVALDLYKEAHKLTEYVERYEDSECSYSPCDYENCSCCESNRQALPVTIMVELLDHNKQHIAGNWINNSSIPCNYTWDNWNCLMRQLSSWYDVDLRHITWGQDAEALKRTRYVRVFTRAGDDCGDIYQEVDKGIELDINKKRYTKFVKTKLYGVDIETHDFVY